MTTDPRITPPVVGAAKSAWRNTPMTAADNFDDLMAAAITAALAQIDKEHPSPDIDAWAIRVANARQGQSSSPRCESPGAVDIGFAKEWVRRVLAAAPKRPGPSDAEVEAMDRARDPEWWEGYDNNPLGRMRSREDRLAAMRRALAVRDGRS